MIPLSELTWKIDQNTQVIVDGDHVRPATVFEKLKCRFSTPYLTHQTVALLTLLINALRNEPRVTPAEAYLSPSVYILRAWIHRCRHILKNHECEPLLHQLKTELTAYRLGITAANLNASEGLQKFADKKAFLYNYLAFYEHTLKPADDSSEVHIMMDDQYIPWSKAKKLSVDQPDVPGIWPWRYGEHGLQNVDFAVWNDPMSRSFKRKVHPCPGKYLFSYTIFCSALFPRYTGEHSWFRLTDPDGNVYEFGKYRPPNVWGISNALVNYPATIQSPDLTTMWPISPITKPPLHFSDATCLTEIHFEITEEDFHNALEKIKEIKQAGVHSFGLFDESCVVMSHEVAEVCGIRIDTRSAVLKLYFPLWAIRIINKIQAFLPKIVVEALYFIPGVITNIGLCLFMGATKRYAPGGKRHIDTFWDVLNPEKSYLHHPWYVATSIKEDVEANRPPGNPFGIPFKYRIR